MPAKTKARRPADYIGERVKRARGTMHQQDLVARLDELGFTGWRQTKITKIERGEVKRLSIDYFLALAVALSVDPVRLLLPAEGDIELTPKLRRTPIELIRWWRNSEPLIPEDRRRWWEQARNLVTEAEWRQLEEENRQAKEAIPDAG